MNNLIARVVAPAIERVTHRAAEQRRRRSGEVADDLGSRPAKGPNGGHDGHFDSALEALFDHPLSEERHPGPGIGKQLQGDRWFEYDPARGRLLLAAIASLALMVAIVVLVRTAVSRDAPAPSESSPTSARDDLPPVPADAPEEGSYAESRVTPDGEVRVQQWVRSSTPIFGLRLTVPSASGGPAPVEITNVFVAADQFVLNQPGTLGRMGHRLFFSAPPLVVYVRYTLAGAVATSPSVPGRALARVTGLDMVSSPQTGPHRVSVLGDTVLSMACAPTTGVLSPCGRQGKGRWTVELRGGDRQAAIVAQMNLGAAT